MLWIKEKNSYWKQWILSAILLSFAVNTAFQLRPGIGIRLQTNAVAEKPLIHSKVYGL